MIRALTALWVLAGALVLAACQPVSADLSVTQTARAAFKAVRAGDEAALMAMAVPGSTPEGLAQVVALKDLIPPGEVLPRTVGYHYVGAPDSESAVLIDEYDYGEAAILAEITLQRARGEGAWKLRNVHFQVATAKELAIHRFDLFQREPKHWAFLVAALASPLLMVAALIKVILTKGLRRKWLWGVLAFVGVTSIKMIWSTGALTFQPLYVVLLGASAFKADSLFAGWVVSMTLPVFAVLILTGVLANPKRAKAKSDEPKPKEPERPIGWE